MDLSPPSTVKVLDTKTHALLRPDSYIGPITAEKRQDIVFTPTSAELRTIMTSRGALNCAREIMDNTYDNATRPDSGQSRIDVTVWDDSVKPKPGFGVTDYSNVVTVSNNGKGIPVVPYVATDDSIELAPGTTVPEALFNSFLASSNYDDSSVRAGGGRNGIGAKGCNVFSKWFRIEDRDAVNGKVWKMEWADNMKRNTKPRITSKSKCVGGMTVSFVLDYERFGITDRDEFKSLVESHAVELSALVPGCRVRLNKKLIPVKSITDLAKLAAKTMLPPEIKLAVDSSTDDLLAPGVAFVVAPRVNSQLPNLTYVNGIRCDGTATDFLLRSLWPVLAPKDAPKRMPKALLKKAVWVVARFTIPNPSFNSQTKEYMNLPSSKFDFKYEPDEKFTKSAAFKKLKSFVIQKLKEAASGASSAEGSLLETNSARFSSTAGIPGYNPAIKAKPGRKLKTTLILCEGNSAKNTATTIVSVVGRTQYGVFPLRGKGANFRKSPGLVDTNREYGYFKQMMRLKEGMVFTTPGDVNRLLAYDHVMIMADQDKDGSHIAGLIINMIQARFPSLLKVKPDLIQRFITPIVKVTKGSKSLAFYSEAQFETWKESPEAEALAPFKTKRYKGLGTSSRKETLEYAENLKAQTLQLIWNDSDLHQLELSFGKDVKPRTAYLESPEFDGSASLDYTNLKQSVSQFMIGEVWPYHWTSVQRGITRLDGWKQVHHKILNAFMTEPSLKNEIKVDTAASKVALTQEYSYGVQSIAAALPLMAQTYIGCHNVAMFQPLGQFGTRVGRHSDHASPRYISTKLSPICRAFHPAADDPILDRTMEESGPAEPSLYAQVAPLLIINGVDLSIGTGYAYSGFTPHEPLEVVSCVEAWLECHADVPVSDRDGVSDAAELSPAWAAKVNGLMPWWRWFKGDVRKTGDSKYTLTGIWAITKNVGSTTITVTELPPKVTTDAWREKLESSFLIKKRGPSKTRFIRYIEDNSTDTTVNVKIVCDSELPTGWEKKLQLVDTATRSSIIVCEESRATRYATLSEYLDAFCRFRYKAYAKRVSHQLLSYAEALAVASERYRYVKSVVDGELVVARREQAVVESDMAEMGFVKIKALLSMAMSSMTVDKLADLKAVEESWVAKISTLEGTTLQALWREDLAELRTALGKYEQYVTDLWKHASGPKKKARRF